MIQVRSQRLCSLSFTHKRNIHFQKSYILRIYPKSSLSIRVWFLIKLLLHQYFNLLLYMIHLLLLSLLTIYLFHHLMHHLIPFLTNSSAEILPELRMHHHTCKHTHHSSLYPISKYMYFHNFSNPHCDFFFFFFCIFPPTLTLKLMLRQVNLIVGIK